MRIININDDKNEKHLFLITLLILSLFFSSSFIN